MNSESSGDKVSHRTTVRILGETYTLRGTASPEHMEKLARMVDAQMREIQQQNRQLVLHRLAILAAIHLAHELEMTRQELAEMTQLLEEAR